MKGDLLRVGSACILAAIVIAGSMIANEALQTKRKAEHLLVEVRALRVGDSNLDQIYQLAERYNGRLPVRLTCKISTCWIKINITNESLSKYHLATSTGFDVAFLIKQGRTVHLELELWSEVKGLSYYFKRVFYGQETGYICFANVSDDSEDSGYYNARAGYFVRMDYVNKPEKIIVQLTPSVGATIREKAMEFNVGCLSKVDGCVDPREILPALWGEHDSRTWPSSEIVPRQN